MTKSERARLKEVAEALRRRDHYLNVVGPTDAWCCLAWCLSSPTQTDRLVGGLYLVSLEAHEHDYMLVTPVGVAPHELVVFSFVTHSPLEIALCEAEASMNRS